MSSPMNDARSADEASLREANELRRKSWAKEADAYDKRMGFIERRILGSEHRRWACSRTTGKTLEVAVGTGLNLASYPPEIELVGLDLSPEMIDIARRRATELGREVDLRVGDAHALPFDAGSFDAVLCTFSLCNIPEPRLAVAEMKRVLRPDGHLVLVDHIGSDAKPIFWIQRAIEFFSIRSEGEHMTRRSLAHVTAEGFEIVERDRLGPGRVVERILALKPVASESA
ncbi:MAG: methyltransferase domain-containing protein [Actinomycetota bacterium]|nr:methyltransferase domain-containing protein [Actinomycetota bacterium]